MNVWYPVSAACALSFLLLSSLPLARVLAARVVRTPCREERSGHILCMLLFWFALQLTLATTLAMWGVFTLPAALIGNGIFLCSGLVLQRWATPPRQPAAVTVLPHFSLPVQLYLATMAWITALLGGNLLVQPVTDYDSLYYHLPFMANLHATGQLTQNSVAAVVAWYPYGWETLCTLLLLPIDRDMFVALPNLLVWGLCGLALYVGARQLRVARSAALAAALLWLTQPLVLDQLNSLRVDLALAAFFLAGVALLFVATPIRSPAHPSPAKLSVVDLLPLLLCTAILPAIKTSGLIYSALLALLLIARLLFVWRRGNAQTLSQPAPASGWGKVHAPLLPTTVGGIVVGIVVVIVIGGVSVTTLAWYLRNWFIYANPVGTVEVRLGPWLLFEGATTRAAVQQTTLATLFSLTNGAHLQLYATQIWQQGNLPLLGLLGFAGWALCDLRNRARRRTILGGALLLLLLSLLYWITPYSGDDGSFGYQLNGPWVGQAMRFALPALGTLALLAAVGLDAFIAGGGRQGQFGLGLPPLLALAALGQRSTLYLIGVGLAVLVLLLYRWYHKIAAAGALFHGTREGNGRWQALQASRKFVSTSGVFLAVLLVLLLSLALPVLHRLRDERRAQVYGPLPTLVDDLTAPGATLAALHSHQSYLANGLTLQRQVVQLPRQFADAHDLQIWLQTRKIAFVIVGPLRPEWQADPQVHWFDDPAYPLMLLYDGYPDHPRLYQLLYE